MLYTNGTLGSKIKLHFAILSLVCLAISRRRFDNDSIPERVLIQIVAGGTVKKQAFVGATPTR